MEPRLIKTAFLNRPAKQVSKLAAGLQETVTLWLIYPPCLERPCSLPYGLSIPQYLISKYRASLGVKEHGPPKEESRITVHPLAEGVAIFVSPFSSSPSLKYLSLHRFPPSLISFFFQSLRPSSCFANFCLRPVVDGCICMLS